MAELHSWVGWGGWGGVLGVGLLGVGIGGGGGCGVEGRSVLVGRDFGGGVGVGWVGWWAKRGRGGVVVPVDYDFVARMGLLRSTVGRAGRSTFDFLLLNYSPDSNLLGIS